MARHRPAGRARSPFNYTFPQVLVFVFLLLTTVVGAWKAEVTGSFNVALAWNALNTVVLGIFLAVTYREARTARAARRRRDATHGRGSRRRARRARRRAPDHRRRLLRPTRPRPSLEAPDELPHPPEVPVRHARSSSAPSPRWR